MVYELNNGCLSLAVDSRGAQLLRLGLCFGFKGLRAFLTVKGAHDRARKRKAV